MCRHYWLLEMTTPTGTPACCKRCGKERVFCAKDVFGLDYRGRPHITPSRTRKDEMPFDPHRFEPRSRLRGVRL